MAKGNISRKMKKINGGSLSGDGNILLEKGRRLIKDITLDADTTEMVGDRYVLTFDEDTDGNAFSLSHAFIYVLSPVSSALQNGFIQIKGAAGGNYGASSNTQYGSVYWYSNSASEYLYAEVVTDDNFPTHLIFANRSFTGIAGDNTQLKFDFGTKPTQAGAPNMVVHKEINGIRFTCAQPFRQGMRIMILGVDK